LVKSHQSHEIVQFVINVVAVVCFTEILTKMDYQQANYQQGIGSLPSSNANEKALLWSQPGQYMIDSGYTTQVSWQTDPSGHPN
jgi:hypothetical protein